MRRVSDKRAIWLARNVLPHEPALRAWLKGRKLAGLEIDDIVQETYARLISAESVEGVLNPRTYTFSTAYSVILTEMRRAKVVSFQTVADIDELGLAAIQSSPEIEVVDRDELHRLARAIAGLPAKVREVFRLRRVEGLSQRNVAARLGIAESTVEKHMSRGLYLLMEVFGRSGEHPAHAPRCRCQGGCSSLSRVGGLRCRREVG